jgi:hypothetical protein
MRGVAMKSKASTTRRTAATVKVLEFSFDIRTSEVVPILAWGKNVYS